MASSSGTVAGRETLDQQQGHQTPPLVMSTNAYTQHGVMETFGPGPQRPKANERFIYPTTIDHRDLHGQGSQGLSASSMQHESRTVRMDEAFMCPYHGSILQGRPTNAQSGRGLTPMDRYVAEGPSERYAILHRPDAGNGSTHNGCRCLEMMQSGVDAKSRAQK